MIDKTNYKKLGFGAFWNLSFKAAGASFWTMLMGTLACVVGLGALGLVYAVLGKGAPWIFVVLAVILVMLYYVAAVKVAGSAVEGNPVGVFSAMQSGGIKIFHVLAAAVLISVPVSLISIGLYYAGVNNTRVDIAVDAVFLLAAFFFSFAPAAIILREKNFIAALGYSFTLVKSGYFKALFYMVAASMFILALSAAFGAGIYAASSFAGGSETAKDAVMVFEWLAGAGLAAYIAPFFFGAYAVVFFKLENAVYGGIDFDALEKTKPAKVTAPSAEPPKNFDNLPESEKFYRSIFKTTNQTADSDGSGEMPTIYVDTSKTGEEDIEKILQNRLREREKKQQAGDEQEKTVTLSQPNLEIVLEDTSYLPERKPGANGNAEPSQEDFTLPPPGPVAPRLKVVNVPPRPPEKDEENM